MMMRIRMIVKRMMMRLRIDDGENKGLMVMRIMMIVKRMMMRIRINDDENKDQ